MKNSYSLAALFILGACSSYNQPWPRLSDPLPDSADRTRAVVRNEPAKPSVSDTLPQSFETLDEATSYFRTISQNIASARRHYIASRSSLDRKESQDEGIVTWREGQLMLTRLSQATAPLDALIYNTQPALKTLSKEARKLADETELYVVGERKYLNSKKP